MLPQRYAVHLQHDLGVVLTPRLGHIECRNCSGSDMGVELLSTSERDTHLDLEVAALHKQVLSPARTILCVSRPGYYVWKEACAWAKASLVPDILVGDQPGSIYGSC